MQKRDRDISTSRCRDIATKEDTLSIASKKLGNKWITRNLTKIKNENDKES